MTSLFIALAALGAVVLLLQIAMTLLGLDGPHEFDAGTHSGDASLAEGLDLLSVRSLSAGAAFFGLGGLAAQSVGVPTAVAVLVGLVAGAVGLTGTSLLMRQILRLESDGSLKIEGAVGVSGTVYLTIPAGQSGPGKVHVPLQGRTVELAAVTSSGTPIPNGAPVVVVAVVDSDTVEVLPVSLLQEVIDGDS